MLVIQVGSLVFQEHIDDPWVAVPTCYFKRHPLLPSLDIRVSVFFVNEVVDHRLVCDRASNVKRRKVVIPQHVQIYRDVLRQRHSLCRAINLRLFPHFQHLALLLVYEFSFFNLILLQEPHQLLLLAVHSDHVTNLVNQHRIESVLLLLHGIH